MLMSMEAAGVRCAENAGSVVYRGRCLSWPLRGTRGARAEDRNDEG